MCDECGKYVIDFFGKKWILYNENNQTIVQKIEVSEFVYENHNENPILEQHAYTTPIFSLPGELFWLENDVIYKISKTGKAKTFYILPEDNKKQM